jgi:hypothetical protein
VIRIETSKMGGNRIPKQVVMSSGNAAKPKIKMTIPYKKTVRAMFITVNVFEKPSWFFTALSIDPLQHDKFFGPIVKCVKAGRISIAGYSKSIVAKFLLKPVDNATLRIENKTCVSILNEKKSEIITTSVPA